MLTRMEPIEFELERTTKTPMDRMFARRVDLEGHNWPSTHLEPPGESGTCSSRTLRVRLRC